MNPQQIAQSRSSANGFPRRRSEKEIEEMTTAVSVPPQHVRTANGFPRRRSEKEIEEMTTAVSVPPQHVRTGREGEREAFRYFSSTLSGKKVKWVNEVNESGLPYDILVEGKDESKEESGLPYDILVEGKDESKEYIEVKSTSVAKSAKKDWFYLSMNEWKFAEEKGECFSIARVVLSDGKSPVITIYRNPAKLCQNKKLHVALHLSKY